MNILIKPMNLMGGHHLLSFLASLGGVHRQHVTVATANLQLALVAVPVKTQIPANHLGAVHMECVASCE